MQLQSKEPKNLIGMLITSLTGEGKKNVKFSLCCKYHYSLVRTESCIYFDRKLRNNTKISIAPSTYLKTKSRTSPHVTFIQYIIMYQACSMNHFNDLCQTSMLFSKFPELEKHAWWMMNQLVEFLSMLQTKNTRRCSLQAYKFCSGSWH